MRPLACLTLSLCLCILAIAPPTPGASFLPDDEELARMSPEQRAEAEAATALLLAGVDPDQKTFRIDDMVFDIPGDLSISSAFKGSRWVEGRVWYEFDANVSAENRARWLEAAAEWEAVANLSFRQRTDQYSRIYVKSGDENWSKVGLGIGGKRDMEISNWNSKYVIVHEIGHALGLMHEHCRTGRGDRIIIHWDRIELGKRHNFFWAASTRYGGYDFDSNMHYPRRAFPQIREDSRDTITMRPGFEDWIGRIGQRTHLTALDKQGMAERYGSVPRQVTEPAGADVYWVHGNTYRVRWRGFTNASSRVELMDGDAVVWEIASAERSSSLEWGVPSAIPAGNDYRIRVTSTSDTVRTALSDPPFTIVDRPRVLYPSGTGIRWALGETYAITWENMRGPSVRISLLRDGALERVIAATTPNDGEYEWYVPNSQAIGDEAYTILVESLSVPELADASNQPFSIRIRPQVTSPGSGDGPWRIGETHYVYWRGFAADDDRVRIVLEDADSSAEQVLASSIVNSGVYHWTIDPLIRFARYYVRVESLAHPERIGRSSTPIQISGDQVILEPAGEDARWYLGGRHAIRWAHFLGSTVRIDLYKNYIHLETIASATPNDGYLLWTVPDYPVSSGDFFYLRITSNENRSQYAESDWFDLVDPPALVTVPSDPGTVFPTEVTCNIQWVGFPGDTVSIYVYRGELTSGSLQPQGPPGGTGPVWTLSLNAPNTGTFAWNPPSTMPTDTEYRVRIIDNGDPSVFDDSDHAFSITPGILIAPMVAYPTASDVVWTRGADHPIHWRHFRDTLSVRIDLFRDGAFDRSISASTGNDGVHYWTVPPGVRIGPGHTVRVRSLQTGATAFSAHPFTILGTQQVTHPSDPDVIWYRGDTMPIEWTEFLNHFEVRIELYHEGVLDRTIVAETLNDGAYDWDIPEDLPLSFRNSWYQIKVTSGTNDHEHAFSIPVRIRSDMRVELPERDFGITPGNAHSIAWSGLIGKEVRIDLFQNGLFLRTIAAVAPNTGQFQWTLTAKDAALGSDYQIRIQSLSDPDELVFLTSAFEFTAPPEILYPIGPIPWRAGQTHTIKWLHFLGENLRIALTHKDMAEPYLIAQSAPNSGAFNWKIPFDLPPAKDYRLELISDWKKSETAVSEDFTVLPPARVTAPGPGAVWPFNTQPAIAWSDFSGESVAIHLLRPNATPIIITQETTNDGDYAFWTVSPDLTPGDGFRIQVVSLAEPDESAFSEPFSITALPPTVISPRPVEDIWYRGGEYAIEWTGFDTQTLRIELFRDDVLDQTLSPDTANTGLFVWTIPADIPFGKNFSVRVTAVDVAPQQPQEPQYAVSEGYFEIADIPADIEPPDKRKGTWILVY